MMHRGMIGKRLTVEDLNSSAVVNGRLADQIPKGIMAHCPDIVKAIYNRQWESAKALLIEVHNANFRKVARNVFSDSGHWRTFAKAYRSFFENPDRSGEGFKDTDKFELMWELAKFSHDAPPEGDCMAYLK